MGIRDVFRTTDVNELETFNRFLTELDAHKQLEALVGKRIPFDTVTVDRSWWNPKGGKP